MQNEKTVIFWLFLADYHSGQFTRGYRVLSRIQARIRRHKIDVEKYERARIRETPLYNLLAAKFGRKV